MNSRLTRLLFLALFLTFCAEAARASLSGGGVSSGGGGDNLIHDPGDAWFVGRGRPFRYCLEVSRDFGASAGFARGKVAQAFHEWEVYLERKLPDRVAENFPSTAAVLQESCQPDTDLVFFLGIQNPKTREAARAYQDPVAFQSRETRHLPNRWSRGFVWVRAQPHWDFRDRLFGVLLHEIGHILGNAHVPETIMSEEIARFAGNGDVRDQLTYDLDGSAARLTSIDQGHELVLCRTCRASFHGILSWADTSLQNPSQPDHRTEARTAGQSFELFTGRKANGIIHADWEYRPAPAPEEPSTINEAPEKGMSLLTLRDSSGNFVFETVLASVVTTSPMIELAFSPYPAAFLVNDTGLKSPDRFEPAGAFSELFGTIRAASGKTYPVVVQRNAPAGTPLRILYLDEGRAYDLMVTRLANSTDWLLNLQGGFDHGTATGQSGHGAP